VFSIRLIGLRKRKPEKDRKENQDGEVGCYFHYGK
jgi:hypothetical protein